VTDLVGLGPPHVAAERVFFAGRENRSARCPPNGVRDPWSRPPVGRPATSEGVFAPFEWALGLDIWRWCGRSPCERALPDVRWRSPWIWLAASLDGRGSARSAASARRLAHCMDARGSALPPSMCVLCRSSATFDRGVVAGPMRPEISTPCASRALVGDGFGGSNFPGHRQPGNAATSGVSALDLFDGSEGPARPACPGPSRQSLVGDGFGWGRFFPASTASRLHVARAPLRGWRRPEDR